MSTLTITLPYFGKILEIEFEDGPQLSPMEKYDKRLKELHEEYNQRLNEFNSKLLF